MQKLATVEAAVAWVNWPRLVCHSADAYCPRAALHSQSASARRNWPRLMCQSAAARLMAQSAAARPIALVKLLDAQPLPSSLVL